MKNLMKYKVMLASLVMALLVLVTGSTVEAKTVNRKVTDDYKTIYYVGETYSISGANFKINGKKISKFKKKVKANLTDWDEYDHTYQKSKFYEYGSAYKQGTSINDGKKWVARDTYEFTFLKAGTYKISTVDYANTYGGHNYYRLSFSRSERVNGTRVYYYKLQQITENSNGGLEYKDVSTEEYVEKELVRAYDGYTSSEVYYQGTTSNKIYVNTDDYGVCPAVIKKGADGQQYLYIEPIVVKTTTIKTFKVLKTSRVVASVQLGKSKIAGKTTSNGTSSTSTSTSKKFLSGKSGKLTVKMADKNYSLQNIVVLTYDKDGKPEYKLVKNKKKITYGANKSLSYSQNTDGSYNYKSTSLFKPTVVCVFYKNKYTGGYCKINKIYKDAYGNNRFDYTYYYQGAEKASVVTGAYYLPDNYCYTYTFYKK